MQKIYYCLFISALLTLCSQEQSLAQQVNKKALEKANWYSSPREFQIIDDRPVVKDFREGPQQSQTVDLGAGAAGGGGAGSSIPAGGMHFGQPSVRTAQDNLPKSSFGSNIPARGVAPSSGLPGAGLKSYAGQLKGPQAGLGAAGNRSYVPQRTAGSSSSRSTAQSRPAVTAPSVKSYGGGYSTAPTTTTHNTTTEQLRVRGNLLRSK